MIDTATASIGVAEGRYASADTLLRDADTALYAAMAGGKNRFAMFGLTPATLEDAAWGAERS